jgi:uncharacterized protein involved in high-affinity Fe2+ transport
MDIKIMRIANLFVLLAAITMAGSASAREYFIGGPVKQNDMEIVANYLKGIEMSGMGEGEMKGMAGMGKADGDVIHLEADIHATADNPYGYGDGEWVPYLTIHYDLKKAGSDWTAEGVLLPMTAKDGPHYANNLPMGGEGTYRLTYHIAPPANGVFWRHIDKETGVPDWWKPITVSFDFKYPQK